MFFEEFQVIFHIFKHKSYLFNLNKIALIIFVLAFGSANAQVNCTLKLTDSYSLDAIQLNNSLEIKNAEFSIDTVNNG